ncbi:Vacuolar protein-sorting-associated protein 36 [Fusarium falciforme]|nr:Vacuolar protein-sorting-associated protein 36 [Fusarium falciforme]
MFLKHIDLTTALRPSYLTDEVLLFVQDNVGLYEGKYKLPNQQNGQVYLTSHRVCYVDQKEPRTNSVALDLKDVDRYEFYAGFLKSSAKVTLFPKPPKRASYHSRAISNASSSVRNVSGSPGHSESGYRPPRSHRLPRVRHGSAQYAVSLTPSPPTLIRLPPTPILLFRHALRVESNQL